MDHAEPSAALALAELRAREDGLGRHLDAVRTHLARCTALARELPELERRAEVERARGGAYRTQAGDLAGQAATARAARAERARLRIEEAALMLELDQVRARLERRGIRRVTLPQLENVSVASPCDASWADMEGDSDTRFCKKCKKPVYNLSMMAREEAEAMLLAAGGRGMCVRLYRRTDGTLLTEDCPVGVGRRRFWRRASGIAAAGLLACALGLAYSDLVCATHVPSTQAAMGGF